MDHSQYYVESSGSGDPHWMGPYGDPRAAREARDRIRAAGGHALVHRSTVAVRAEVKAWTESTTKEV